MRVGPEVVVAAMGPSTSTRSRRGPDRIQGGCRRQHLDREFGHRYSPLVEPVERDEIRAAILASRQLGTDYEGDVAASLVDRIGAEIDRRVDARVGHGSSPTKLHRPIWAPLTLGLGSLLAGVAASGIILNGGAAISSNGIVTHAPSSGQVALDAVVWVVIGAVNVAFLRRH